MRFAPALLSVLSALLLSGAAFAQGSYPSGPPGGQGGPGAMGGPGGMGGQGGMGGPGGQGGQRPPGPPPEAFQVCKGKKDGDAAAMQTPRGMTQGSCRLVWVPGGQGQAANSGQAPAGKAGQPFRSR